MTELVSHVTGHPVDDFELLPQLYMLLVWVPCSCAIFNLC